MKVYIIFINEYPCENNYPIDVHRIVTDKREAAEYVVRMNAARVQYYDPLYSWEEQVVEPPKKIKLNVRLMLMQKGWYRQRDQLFRRNDRKRS